MKKRRLGNSELEVAPLAFGGNVFGWRVDERTAFQLLDAFVHAGFNLIDTADAYSKWAPGNSGGESETVIGKWLQHTRKRKDVILATKVGMEMGAGRKGLSKPYILQAVEESLRRLQTDYIDLYQSHVDDPDTPLEETLAAYDQLIREGKVRAIGASNFSAERLSQALAVSKQHGYASYQSLQPLYNLYDRSEYEIQLEPVCRKNGLGVISYFSLARGFLTGKYRTEQDLSQSPRGAGVKQYLNDRGFRILSALDQVAKRSHSTPAAISLAWLMVRPAVTAPITSATNLNQLNELIAASQLDLDRESIELLNQASAPASASTATA